MIHKQWDKELEGQDCPRCGGKGAIEETYDIKNVGALLPCPMGFFNGHGYPICKGGKLQFSQYDLDNWKDEN